MSEKSVPQPSGFGIKLVTDLSTLGEAPWYRVTDAEGTDFAMRVHEEDGHIVCTGVIFGLDSKTAISVRSVRAARLTFWLKQFAEWKAVAARQGYQPGTGSGPLPPRLRRPGSSRHPENHFPDVAAKFREKVATGTRSPVKDLASDMNVEPITVRKWLQKARSMGLLDDLGAKPGALKGSPEATRKERRGDDSK